SIEGEAQKNCQSPANSLRPCSTSFASISALMRRSIQVAKAVRPSLRAKRSEAKQSMNPPKKNGLLRRFAPRNDEKEPAIPPRFSGWSRLRLGLLGAKRRLEIVE